MSWFVGWPAEADGPKSLVDFSGLKSLHLTTREKWYLAWESSWRGDGMQVAVPLFGSMDHLGALLREELTTEAREVVLLKRSVIWG